jgi:hypothetical protein
MDAPILPQGALDLLAIGRHSGTRLEYLERGT